MPDSSVIETAIVTKLASDTGPGGVATLMPDGVWVDEAPQGARQFVIVSLVIAHDEPMFGGRAFEDAIYLVKAVEMSTVTVKNVKAAAARIDALLDYGDLAGLTGYTLVRMTRDEFIRAVEVDDADPSLRWDHRGGRYHVVVCS